MELLLIVFVIWLFVGPIVALSLASDARKKAEEARQSSRDLAAKVGELEQEVRKLRSERIRNELASTPLAPRSAERQPAKEPPATVVPPPFKEAAAPVDQVAGTPEKPEIPGLLVPVSKPAFAGRKTEGPEPQEPFSLERFMGVKLFAWLGGIAVFFGVIFFVKYAFENNLVPPSLRVTLGFVCGSALLAGGLVVHRFEKYRVLGQVFCATGVLVLYGVSFAAHAIYRFPLFGVVQTLVLMGFITAAAFLTAVRLNALVVAVLGMLGGFIAPVLVSTGRDEVFGLFGYIALLDVGLLAVSTHGRWRPLAAAAAVGTAIMQIGWFARFFDSGQYFADNRILIPMGILLGFSGMFAAGVWCFRKRADSGPWAEAGTLALAGMGMAFAFAMFRYDTVAQRYFLLYGFVLALELCVFAVVFLRPQWMAAQTVAGVLAFVHLAVWSSGFLSGAVLFPVLAIYLIFGAVGALAPVVLARRLAADARDRAMALGHWFAPFTLVLMLAPFLVLGQPPLWVWVAVLLANALVMVLAFQSRRVLPVVLSVTMTMGLALVWIRTMPARVDQLLPVLGVVCGFASLFALAGKRLLGGITPKDGGGLPTDCLLVAPSAVLPFGLLVLALQTLPVANPSPVFAAAVLMGALLCALAHARKNGWLLLAALAGIILVEAVWHCWYFRPDAPFPALAWYLAVGVAFLAFPFLFRERFREDGNAWVAAALSPVVHFPLVYQLIKVSYPSEVEGLIPAAFSVPVLLALAVVMRPPLSGDAVNRSRVAWFGGVALLFITLVFPIQFERQWITLGWALEGAALLGLFQRVGHPGLRLTGLALLSVAFARLAFNPAVYFHYERSGTPILNWHLYVFGVAAAAMFAGARWCGSGPGIRLTGPSPRALLMTQGVMLLFLLLNIEIADFFTPPGARCVAFEFGGDFARDMTYSIAWGIFALVMLVFGIWKRSRHARYAALGLLGFAVAKVLIHDMAASQTVFRVGALLGVGVIAFAASWLYQRFFDRTGS